MIIQCEKCETKFKIDSSRIKPSGSNVRCSKCGHIFSVRREEPTADINAPELPGLVESESPLQDTPAQESPIQENQAQENQAQENQVQENTVQESAPAKTPPQEDEALDIEIDRAPKDSGNWEDFVSISKTGAQESGETKEAVEESSTPGGQDQFDWQNINIDDEDQAGEKPSVPEMFEEEEPQEEVIEKPETPPRETYSRRDQQKLSLDDKQHDDLEDHEGYYSKASEATVHRGSAYSKKSSPKGIIGKIISTLLIAAVFVVIIAASAAILINLGLIPKEQVTQVKTLVESIIPVKLSSEPAPAAIITNHGGKWVSTRYGPLYVVSGTVQNVSDAPIHYIQIRSVFTAAGELVYDDMIYAGNTFTENELRLSRTEDVVQKLKKKSGDIDYYDTDKLSGLNYDIQPGQTVPFFAVLPSDSTLLGLRYNLEIVGYESPESN